jgi:DNA-binding protein WhiA
MLRVTNGEALARQTGLLDTRGRPANDLAPHLLTGAADNAEATWRGAFLARGSLTGPGHCSALKITCPGPRAALALVCAADLLGVHASARQLRGGDHAVVRNNDAINTLLTRMGAHDTRLAFEQRRMQHKDTGQVVVANRLASLHRANQRRSAAATPAVIARIEHALQLLGDIVPDHLASAAKLRLKHPRASLEELGRLADPPMTKDTVAGRIRRLLVMADRKAAHDVIA